MQTTLTSRYRLTLALLGASAIVSAGCGGGVGHVSGRVVHKDGSPLDGANIVARCAETGKSVYATSDAQGHFEMSPQKPGEGVPPGSYEATIMERRLDRESAIKPTIAAKYSDPTKSGLNFTVAAGETKTFDVTVDPP